MTELETKVNEGEERDSSPSRSPWLSLLPLLLLTALLAVSVHIVTRCQFQRERFYPGTRVEGLEISLLTAEEAAEKLQRELEARSITVLGEDGVAARLPLGSLLRQPEGLGEATAALLSRQHGVISLFTGMRGVDSDFQLQWKPQGALLTLLKEEIGGYGLRQASSARLQKNSDGWSLLPSCLGSYPLTEDCAAALDRLLRLGGLLTPGTELPELTLELQWVQPETTSDDPVLNRRLEALEKGIATPLWLDFGDGLRVLVSRERLTRVFGVRDTEDGAQLLLSEDMLRLQLDEIVEELGADGIRRKLGVLGREEVHENDWDTGFHLDREKLYREAADTLRGGGGFVIASYDYTSSADQAFGVGDTYIEVSIENQTLWLYDKGELLLTTPVRTGNIATNDGTRPGLFQVSYKQQRTYLSRYGFWVDVWIPFDGHIGIHDASWVEEFGGDIYLTNGSHGCVNVPPAVAGIIFDHCDKGSWVLVY